MKSYQFHSACAKNSMVRFVALDESRPENPQYRMEFFCRCWQCRLQKVVVRAFKQGLQFFARYRAFFK